MLVALIGLGNMGHPICSHLAQNQTKDPLPFVHGTEFVDFVEEVGHSVTWPKIENA
jgi:3-hydroxyisobutyrate dehydrogenase-like beta-hydroxyacid dehydrogenase